MNDDIQKPIVNVNIRADNTQTLNFCKTDGAIKYVLADPTPGAANLCLGKALPTLYSPDLVVDADEERPQESQAADDAYEPGNIDMADVSQERELFIQEI